MDEMHPSQAYKYETSPVKSPSTFSSHTYYVSHSALPEVSEHVRIIYINNIGPGHLRYLYLLRHGIHDIRLYPWIYVRH